MPTPEPVQEQPTDDMPKPGRRQSVNRVFRKIKTVLQRRQTSKEHGSAAMKSTEATSPPVATITEEENEQHTAAPLPAPSYISADQTFTQQL